MTQSWHNRCKWADFADQDVREKVWTNPEIFTTRPPLPFLDSWVRIFLKGKFASKWQKFLLKRKSGLYSDPHPQTIFFFTPMRTFIMDKFPQKTSGLCAPKRGKKNCGFRFLRPPFWINPGFSRGKYNDPMKVSENVSLDWLTDLTRDYVIIELQHTYLTFFFNFAWLIWWQIACIKARGLPSGFSQS